MGQQQLLLLVLGIVIVGLAVVVGIQAFGENQKKANADAMTNDAIRIASDAQAWSLKPTAFGGGNGVFTDVTLAKLGYTTVTTAQATPFTCTVGNYSNLNGCYAMPTGTSAGVVITGTNTSTKNQVQTTVINSTPGGITTTVSSTS